jgi:hypothetical protein
MDAKEQGPAPGATGNGPNANDSRLNDTDGQAAKQLALGLFEQNRKAKLAEARPLFVQVLREQGRSTIDDLRDRMQIPDEYDPRWLGAVPGPLARRGIIRHVGYRKSERRVAHARELRLWELVREPRPGELEDLRGSAPKSDRPAGRPGEGAAGGQGELTSRPDRKDVHAGPGPLFPELRPPYQDPGDVGLDRAGRRRR